MRTIKTYTVKNPKEFTSKLFYWNRQFQTSIWLDSNTHNNTYSSFDVCLAAEEFTSIKTDYNGAFDKLKEYQSYTKDYIFGYIAYDVKNNVENLHSKNFDKLGFDDIFFFQPQKLIFIKGNTIEFRYLKMIDDEIEGDFKTIIGSIIPIPENIKTEITIQQRIDKEKYYKKITKVIEHIQQGDIYEANFCQEFYAEQAVIDPYKTYQDLNKISEAPFATFMRLDKQYLASATPERYIRKENTKIISQPIKGTAKRHSNDTEDKQAIFNLQSDEKERSENIMIVDLVRNDLSKTAKKGSVNVEELCKVYTFKQVHQLISTVTSKIEYTTHPIDVIRETFPMGSMTGAPKVAAMKIIEELEETKRGLYSGTVGYITPDNNFDFNVIIRSILYNADEKYVSYSVGGAITAKSTPEKEYEECLLKAKAMKLVLTNH